MHGISLLRKDSDSNRRLAMISIDNAVELMIKTYLGLPKRITRLSIPRREFLEIQESFPALLDALEKYAKDKLFSSSVELGEIEWYHRLRNQLYHQGNGLTVERDKVEIYSQLAIDLFRLLFGYDLPTPTVGITEDLGEFMAAWAALEEGLREIASRNSLTGVVRTDVRSLVRFLREAAIIQPEEAKEIYELREIRNEVVHGRSDLKSALSPTVMSRTKFYAQRFAIEG